MTLAEIKNTEYFKLKSLNVSRRDFLIYKITNLLNHKIYVGQTVNLSDRLNHYFGSYKNNKRDYYIVNSLIKHGLENFSFEILEKVEKRDQLNDREIFWIAHYKSNNSDFGYNLTPGGNNFPPSEETKTKQRNRAKNKKEVFIYDKQGNFLSKYESVRECARSLGTTAPILFKAIKNNFLVKNSFMIRYLYSKKIEPHQYRYKEGGKAHIGKVPPKTFKWKLTDLSNGKVYEEIGIRKLAEVSGYKEDIIRSIAYGRPFYKEYIKMLKIEKLEIYTN